jgi:hypothetical protein
MPVVATTRGEAAFAAASAAGKISRVINRTVTMTAAEARAMRPAPVARPREHVARFRQAGVDGFRLGAPLELKAGGSALPDRFTGTAYSGGFVPDYEVVIDLGTTTFNQKLPLLDNHYRGGIVGVVESASAKDHRMTVAGRLFSDMPGSPAERIAQLAQRGVPFEMSVGLYAFTTESIPAGKSVNVNGQVFNGPVNVLRKGQVREVSIVTLGADPKTAVQVFTR